MRLGCAIALALAATTRGENEMDIAIGRVAPPAPPRMVTREYAWLVGKTIVAAQTLDDALLDEIKSLRLIFDDGTSFEVESRGNYGADSELLIEEEPTCQ